MLDRAKLEEALAALPIFQYAYFSPADLVFTERVRHVCETECPMYGKTWACPPAVGTVEECRARCLSYPEGLMISTVTEVGDVENLEETLSTRKEHEEITHQVAKLVQAQGWRPMFSPPRRAPCARSAPTRTPPAAIQTRCTPAWRATGFWSRIYAKSRVWSFSTATSSPGFP